MKRIKSLIKGFAFCKVKGLDTFFEKIVVKNWLDYVRLIEV